MIRLLKLTFPLAGLLLTSVAIVHAQQQTINATFTYQGTIPSPQTYAVTGPNGWLLAVQLIGDTGWLSANIGGIPITSSPLTYDLTGGNVTLSVNPSVSSLAVGTYTTTVHIYINCFVSCPSFKYDIIATLVVYAAHQSAGNVNFTYQIGGAVPSPQTYSITSTTNSVITNIAVHSSGQSWLLASVSSTTSPTTLTIAVNPVGLAAGSYSGTAEVTCNCSNVLDYNVYLTVTPAPPPLTASPSTVVFNAVQGSAPPASQSVQIGASLPSGTAIFSTTTPSPLPTWLLVNNLPSTFWVGVFNSPAALQFSIDPSFTNLAPGTYTASISFYTITQQSQVTVTVTLNVAAPPPVLVTSSKQLQFQYMIGGATPSSQTVQITSSSTALSATVSSNAAWLLVSPPTGTTPFSLTASVNPANLAVGTYNGQITVATVTNPLNSVPTSTQTIGITLTVVADDRPRITSVMNGASFKPGIAPGAWITITGKNLSGGGTTSQAQTAFLPMSMTGSSVQLTGVGGAYTLLLDYVSPTQINAFVPYEVSPTMYGSTGGAQITVTTPTGSSSYPVDCEAVAPALFVVDNYTAAIAYPSGLIVGTNAGMTTVSSGSIVALYGTGFGQTIPTASNINGPVPAAPLAITPLVSLNGTLATVQWAGMVGIGLYQINIVVPQMPGPGDYPVIVQIGSVSSVGAPLPVR